MRRKVITHLCLVSLAAGAMLCLHMPCAAQTISQLNSWCRWQGLLTDDSALVCPSGDGPSYIEVYVESTDGQPLEGATVYTTLFNASCNYGGCNLHVTTDALGMALLPIRRGVHPLTSSCCEISCRVIARIGDGPVGYLWWNGVWGNTDDTRLWKSFDLDGNGIVNGTTGGWGDVGIFNSDYFTSACRSDFNADGFVDFSDNVLLADAVHRPALVLDGYSYSFGHHGNLVDFGEVIEGEAPCMQKVLQNWAMVEAYWRLVESCPWLTVNPVSTTLPAVTQEPPDPAATVAIDFCVNTAGLALTDYEYAVALVHDPPYDESPYECSAPDTIYVRMTVVEDPTGVAGIAGDSTPITLLQNHPNPFNPVTAIAFELARPSDVSLSVYNMAGRLIRTLESGRMEGGGHEVIWNGRDEQGNNVASGVYYYRLEIDGIVHAKRMVLLR